LLYCYLPIALRTHTIYDTILTSYHVETVMYYVIKLSLWLLLRTFYCSLITSV